MDGVGLFRKLPGELHVERQLGITFVRIEFADRIVLVTPDERRLELRVFDSANLERVGMDPFLRLIVFGNAEHVGMPVQVRFGLRVEFGNVVLPVGLRSDFDRLQPRLRNHVGGRGEVLGVQLLRTAWKRHGYGEHHSSYRRYRPYVRSNEDRGAMRFYLRRPQRRGEVLGI